MVGEKAANLNLLAEKGLNTPAHFCLSASILESWLRSLKLSQDLSQIDSLEDKLLKQKLKFIQNQIRKTRLPDEIIEKVNQALTKLPSLKYAVRSSCPHEDAAAGQFRSFLNLEPEDISLAIKECFASLFSLPAYKKLRELGVRGLEMKMAVIIQKMVEGRGGVINTGPEIKIFAGQTPEAITSGIEEKPHQLTITSKNGKIIYEHFFPGVKILSREEIKKLTELARQIENIFGRRQDIEWIITDEGKIVILQSRPLLQNVD